MKDGWNVFDFFIVSLSFAEMLLEGVKGLSVLRTFRLVSKCELHIRIHLNLINTFKVKFHRIFCS
ncbi:MAG: ion transporter [Pseudobdellovibrionaceae bacterium]